MGRDPWVVVAGEVLMRYLSVCSGIEAATVAWHPLGWRAAGFSEIEKFPSQVLAHHYPDVPNHGDMTNYKEWNLGAIDLLVGGTPCQSFSVAGLRKGMADPRGNLALVYCGILDHFRPKWFVWENVPGVLSSGGGRDFGSFLGALAELGYGFAYRVLDAQWFGVAQRRRRVFVVGCLGDWRSAAAVLFERESLRRDIAPSREAQHQKPYFATSCGEVTPTLSNRDNKGPSCGRDGFVGVLIEHPLGVRKATPTEYERLQGFPRGYTDIQPNGKQTPDGPRYKALGNSMAVPVMRWIGQRIADLEPRSANP
jgi:DNA (cytosine-5)-methyltransferase 1